MINFLNLNFGDCRFQSFNLALNLNQVTRTEVSASKEALSGGVSVRNTENDGTSNWTWHDFVVCVISQNGEKGQKQEALAGGWLCKKHGKRRDELLDIP